jgi:hypothetical protein
MKAEDVRELAEYVGLLALIIFYAWAGGAR